MGRDLVGLYYTAGGGQTMRAIGKRRCWQAGFKMTVGYQTLSIPQQTHTQGRLRTQQLTKAPNAALPLKFLTTVDLCD